jgi:transcriptional regulator with XRE-family HTH domain
MAGEVRRYRKERKITAQQLADRCTSLGVPLHRSVIANLESGRRPLVSVAELLVLAVALNVQPIRLVLPLGRDDNMELLPGRSGSTVDAALWFSGLGDLQETPGGFGARWNDGGIVPLILEHERLVLDFQEDRAAMAGAASDNDIELWRGMRRAIRKTRSELREFGVRPPPLPSKLAYLDEPQQDDE